MEVQNLFNSDGEWLGFRQGIYVFNTYSNWVGWLPWDSDDVVSRHGDYLGTIHHGNRLYRFANRPYRGCPESPPPPEHPGYPGYAGMAGYSPLPDMAKDVLFVDDEYG